MRLVCMLVLLFEVVGAGHPAAAPAQTAFARAQHPSLPVRAPLQLVSTVSGSPQATEINTAFPVVLVVLVTEYTSMPAVGETVTFRAPTSGGVASGTFAGGVTTVDVVSGSDGMATSPVFTANGIAGSYQVRATVSGGATEASFDMTNQSPPTATPTAVLTSTPGSATSTPTNTPPSTPTATNPPTNPPTATSTPSGSPPTATPDPSAGSDGASTVAGGGGPGSPPLVSIQINSAITLRFYAYDPSFLGGVRVALADVNGDGRPDLITAPGQGMEALIRVFDGRNGSLLREFLAFPATFQGGAWVAAGDVTGDGQVDIVVGAGPGGGTIVRVFNGQTGAFIREITDFSGEIAPDEQVEGSARSVPPLLAGALRVKTASASDGGVHVAVGDMDGDGVDEIIADFVATASGIATVSDSLTDLLPLLLIASNGNRNTRCRANNDSLLPLLFLGLNLSAGDINGSGQSTLFMGSDGSNSLLPLILLDSFGSSNNNRRCRRRRSPLPRSYGYGGNYGDPFGYFRVDGDGPGTRADQNFSRPAVGFDANGNGVLYAGASDAGAEAWVQYGTTPPQTNGATDGRGARAAGPGGTYIAAVAPKTARPNSVQNRSDEDNPRRLTETERRQKERTNRLGIDDDRTEGNVISVGEDERGPFAVIANRDGNVTVLLQCDGGCPKVQLGQYLEADGVKEHEQLFTAENIKLSGVR